MENTFFRKQNHKDNFAARILKSYLFLTLVLWRFVSSY